MVRLAVMEEATKIRDQRVLPSTHTHIIRLQRGVKIKSGMGGALLHVMFLERVF